MHRCIFFFITITQAILLSKVRLHFVFPSYGSCIFVGDNVVVTARDNLIQTVDCDGKLYTAREAKAVPGVWDSVRCSPNDPYSVGDLERIIERVCFQEVKQEMIDKMVNHLGNAGAPGSMGRDLWGTMSFALAYFNADREAVKVVRDGMDVVLAHNNFVATLGTGMPSGDGVVVGRQVVLRELKCRRNEVEVVNQKLGLLREFEEVLTIDQGYEVFHTLCRVFFDKVAIFSSVASSQGHLATFWNAAHSFVSVERAGNEITVALSCAGEEPEPVDTHQEFSPEKISFSRLCI